MMGFEFDLACDCCELLLEVVECWSIASLNSFTCLEEPVPVFVGTVVAVLTVSVAPGTLISCCLSKPISEHLTLVGDCRGKVRDENHVDRKDAVDSSVSSCLPGWCSLPRF